MQRERSFAPSVLPGSGRASVARFAQLIVALARARLPNIQRNATPASPPRPASPPPCHARPVHRFPSPQVSLALPEPAAIFSDPRPPPQPQTSPTPLRTDQPSPPDRARFRPPRNLPFPTSPFIVPYLTTSRGLLEKETRTTPASHPTQLDAEARRLSYHRRRLDAAPRRRASHRHRLDAAPRRSWFLRRRLDAAPRPLSLRRHRLDAEARRLSSHRRLLDASARRLSSRWRPLDASARRRSSPPRLLDASARRLSSRPCRLSSRPRPHSPRPRRPAAPPRPPPPTAPPLSLSPIPTKPAQYPTPPKKIATPNIFPFELTHRDQEDAAPVESRPNGSACHARRAPSAETSP
jgi:hypothetical protein